MAASTIRTLSLISISAVDVLRVLKCVVPKMSKCYAVKVGRQPGIYATWEECKRNVDGYTGAIFRKFSTHEEATKYVFGEQNTETSCNTISDIDNTNGNQMHSFNPNTTTTQQSFGEKRSLTVEQRPIGGLGCTCICTCGNGAPPPRKIQKTSNNFTSHPTPPPGLNKDGYIVIYTDGACEANGRSRSKGGIGVYWGPNHPMNISEPLEGRQTNNRAEIMAAVRALNQCKNMGTKKVQICTDSRFLINGITKWIAKWKRNGWKLVNGKEVINKEDFEMLDKARQGLDVKWVHVPGHHGVIGNEEADRLARGGISYMF